MNSSRSLEVYGIVPASGFSRRMKRQKLLLPWRNKAILEHVLETANHSSLNRIFTVIPDEDEDRKRIALKARVDIVTNTIPEKGIGYSLALGMSQIPETADAVMILLGDQPELKVEDIQRVLGCFTEKYSGNDHPSKIIVQTQYADGKTGHPILFSKPFFPGLTRLDGDRGGNQIIHSNLEYAALINSKHRYPPDIDTVEDYESLLIRQ